MTHVIGESDEAAEEDEVFNPDTESVEGTTSRTTTPGADPSTADDPFAGPSGGETITFDPDTTTETTSGGGSGSGSTGGGSTGGGGGGSAPPPEPAPPAPPAVEQPTDQPPTVDSRPAAGGTVSDGQITPEQAEIQNFLNTIEQRTRGTARGVDIRSGPGGGLAAVVTLADGTRRVVQGPQGEPTSRDSFSTFMDKLLAAPDRDLASLETLETASEFELVLDDINQSFDIAGAEIDQIADNLFRAEITTEAGEDIIREFEFGRIGPGVESRDPNRPAPPTAAEATAARAVESRSGGALGGSQDPAFRGDIFTDPAQQDEARERIEQQILEQLGRRGEAGIIDLEVGEVDFELVDGTVVGRVSGLDAFDVGPDDNLLPGGERRLEQVRMDQAKAADLEREFGIGAPNAAIAERAIVGGEFVTGREGLSQVEAEILISQADILAEIGDPFRLDEITAEADAASDLATEVEFATGETVRAIDDFLNELDRADETGALFDFRAARELAREEGRSTVDISIDEESASFTDALEAEFGRRGIELDGEFDRLESLLSGELPGEGTPIRGEPVFSLPGEQTGLGFDFPVLVGPTSAASAVGGGVGGQLVEGATGFAAAEATQQVLRARGLDTATAEEIERQFSIDLPTEEELLGPLGGTVAGAAVVGGTRGFATGGLPAGAAGAAGAVAAAAFEPFPEEFAIPDVTEGLDDLFPSEIAIQEDPRFLPEFILPSVPAESLSTGRFQPPEVEIPDREMGLFGGSEVSVPEEPTGVLGGPEIPTGELAASQQLVGQRQRQRPRPTPSRRRSGGETVPSEFIPEGDAFIGGIGGGVVFNPGTRSIDQEIIETPFAQIDVAGIDPELARVLRENDAVLQTELDGVFDDAAVTGSSISAEAQAVGTFPGLDGLERELDDLGIGVEIGQDVASVPDVTTEQVFDQPGRLAQPTIPRQTTAQRQRAELTGTFNPSGFGPNRTTRTPFVFEPGLGFPTPSERQGSDVDDFDDMMAEDELGGFFGRLLDFPARKDPFGDFTRELEDVTGEITRGFDDDFDAFERDLEALYR